MKEGKKWKGRTGGSYLGQRMLLLIFKVFDVRFAYAIMAVLVPFYMLFNYRAYKAIYHFFRRQFGLTAWKSFAKTYKNHYIFGQVILDRFAVFSGNRDFFEIEVAGNEHFKRLVEGEKGFILASSHIGNFEIGGYLLHQSRKQINALVYSGETATVQNNRSRILGHNNIRLIPVESDMSHLFAIHSALKKGDIVSMPCDRNLGSAKSIKAPFLRGVASFPVGAFALAAALDVEVLSIFVLKRSYRKYTVYVKPVPVSNKDKGGRGARQQQIEESTLCFVKEIEAIIRQYPEQWFNYYEFWE